MAITAFDTLKFARQLKDAGFTEEQAEAQVNAIDTAFTEALDAQQFATKTDLLHMQGKIKEDIADLDARIANLDARIANLDARMISVEKLQWGILLGVIGLIIKSFLG